ncbi:MAG TPA: alpha/beta hydrolase [Rhodospirillaceae bacterium]|nr:alpha/beta hydrolase [Rhodospirillaceae bacterium]HAA91928.1 alpha/beta hydrolase [Rhodospirillaceae bacterium]HAT36581.1 alpha/beta hydrolase [Rhodospirillaceae bacterium]
MAEKEAMVLVPGLLCDRTLWAHQMEFLRDVANPMVADTLSDDSIAHMADRLLAAAPERFALAGLSMGGYVAFEVMRRAPERVSRLALMDTSAAPDDPDKTKIRKGLIRLAEMGKFKGVTPRLLPMLVHEDRLEDEQLCGAITEMAGRVGKDSFVSQQRAIMGRADSRESQADISVPTLVLCGRQDVLTPLEAHEEMADAIPTARLCVIEECGHLATMERPHAVTALMRDWLLRP